MSYDNLTIDKLKAAYKECMWGSRPALCRPELRTPTLGTLDGLPVYTSPYVGEPVYPHPPAMKRGPYLKRRIKRWRRAHPPYMVGKGEFFLVAGREVWCHPDDLPKLRQALANIRPADTEE